MAKQQVTEKGNEVTEPKKPAITETGNDDGDLLSPEEKAELEEIAAAELSEKKEAAKKAYLENAKKEKEAADSKVSETKVSEKPRKKVKAVVMENHECTIATKKYNLKKNSTIEEEEHVVGILQASGIVKRVS